MLSARATDDRGGTTTSAAVRVTINVSTSDAQPPTLTYRRAPAIGRQPHGHGAAFPAPTPSTTCGVANVEFQVDGVALTTASSAPYSATVDARACKFPGSTCCACARAMAPATGNSEWTQAIVRSGGTRLSPRHHAHPSWAGPLRIRHSEFTELPDGACYPHGSYGAGRWHLACGAGGFGGCRLYQRTRPARRGGAPAGLAGDGFIYVYYTTARGGTHNRISRFTVSRDTASGEVALVELPTLGINQPQQRHHSAAMASSGTTPLRRRDQVGANSQNLNSQWQALLRLNDDGGVPSDNPYCTTQGDLACAVWAPGLRNPSTFAVQPGTAAFASTMSVKACGKKSMSLRAAPTLDGQRPKGSPRCHRRHLADVHVRARKQCAGPAGRWLRHLLRAGAWGVGGAFYPSSGPFATPWIFATSSPISWPTLSVLST